MERPLAAWPTMQASMIGLPADPRNPSVSAPCSFTLTCNEASAQVGRDIMQLARDTIAQYPKDEAVREVARLAREFDRIVPHMCEFAEFIDRLTAEKNWSAVTRILGEAGRGRPFSSPFYMVGLVDRVRETFGWPVCKAAAWLDENYKQQLFKGARAIENDYSRFKSLYDLRYACHFIPEGQLLAHRPVQCPRCKRPRFV